MPLSALLYSEVNLFCIAIMLLVFFKIRSESVVRRDERLFLLVLLSNIFFFTLDIIWAFVDSGVSSVLNWTVNILYYMFSGIIGFSWFYYSETSIDSTLVKNHKRIALCALPLALLLVMVLLSIKTGWIFYIDEGNVYHRGALYVLQPLIGCGYILCAAIRAFIYSCKTQNYAEKIEYRTLTLYIVPPLICGLASIFAPGMPLLCVGITLGVLYVYMNLKEQQISIDSLTELNNRNHMMKYLSSKISHQNGEKNWCLIMIDVDNFKLINDKFGHVEGDCALKKVADALRLSGEKHRCMISRYGGDEFVIICDVTRENEIGELCGDLALDLKKFSEGECYELSVSAGYKEYDESIKSGEELLKAADTELYKIKRQKKQAVAK